MTEVRHPGWWARGLLFENCNCTAVCPGHVHFDQMCTFERCIGWWAVRFDEGEFGETSLAGLSAIVAYDSPQHMIEGDWTEILIVDEMASADQREAIESILSGRAEGPWAILSPFVGTWLPTRVLPIRIEEEVNTKRVVVPGILDGTVEAIRGRDRSKPVTFQNMFNQIHPPTMVVATGSTSYDDGEIRVNTSGTHGLWSRFEWKVDSA